MAKLVYMGERNSAFSKRLDQLVARYNLDRHDDVTDIAKLRDTKAKDLLVVKEPRLMRGFDYRSADKKGIALMVCLSFNTHRGFIQALGRVGRGGDPSKRFTYKGSTMVHETS